MSNGSNVTDQDIANALAVIAQWTGAVLGELVEKKGGTGNTMKGLTAPGTNSLHTGSSKVADQIVALGAGVGRTC